MNHQSLILLALFVGACTPHAQVVSDPVSIRYEAGGCYGTCPMFAVTVSSDGNSVFEGRGYTVVKGERRFRVSPATFRAFAEALAPLKPARGSVPQGRECNLGDGASYTVTWTDARGGQQALCWGDHDQIADEVFVRAQMNGAIRLLPIASFVGPKMPSAI